MKNNELLQTAKRLSQELESYYNGELYYCPACGEVIEWDNDRYNTDTQHYICPECNELVDESDIETASIYSYLIENALDFEYRIDSQLNYKSVIVYITLGGPTVWIDTAKHIIVASWGADEACYSISEEICDEIDSYYEEVFNSSIRG